MTPRNRLAWAIILLLVPCAAWSQFQAPISGPTLGYFWDRALGSLRPILGIPGSATVGDGLNLALALRFAEVAPRQDYALAVDESARILIVDLATRQLRFIAGAAATPDRIVFSPTGASAALYYRERRAVQALTGLPEAPAAGDEMDLSTLPPLITAMAVSDRDGIILLGTADGIYAAQPRSGLPVLVSPIGRAGALSFLENSRDVILADHDRNELLWIRDVTGAAEKVLVAGERDGLTRPLAVAVAENNRKVFAAVAGGVAVTTLDGSPLTVLACPCSPSGLHRLKGNSVFRLNEPSNGPIFVLDAETAEPRVLFVPSGGEARPEARSAPATAAPISRGRSRP